MADWDGRGLPPVAAARIARAQNSAVRTSFLGVPAAVSLQAIGFDPVGDVLGCTVENAGWAGYGGCGAVIGFAGGFVAQAPIGSRDSNWAGFRPYADAIRRGYATALARLRQEATALGADGVVGLRLTMTGFDGAREFLALGTAVRARAATPSQRLFLTDLPGTDVAKLLQGGWVPVSLLVGFEVAVRHDDWRTQSQASFWAGENTEVSGYTELVQYARRVVRADVDQQARRLGADGVLASQVALSVREIEPSEQHRDHVAEALLVGTAITQFRRSRRLPDPSAPSVPVLPLANLTPRSTR